MSFHDTLDWTFPVPITYGPGRLSEIATLAEKAGMQTPLVVTDRGSAALPFINQLLSYLAQGGLRATVFSDISPNPLDTEIAKGRDAFRAGGHDGVIAIGGGSGMDGGKAVALTATNDLDLWAFEFERSPPDMRGEAPFPPLICIPTTAGTGAETESTAMITDTEKRMKWCIWHASLKPSFAVLDPELTTSLPKTLTAWTGADAMVHAIEAYCVPGTHPMCDGMALEGLRLIARWLPAVTRTPEDIEARGAMLTGSCMAGVAFMKGLGLVHAISHMIGAEFDTQHGLTNAILLPSVLRFNAPAIADKITPLAQAIALSDHSFDAFHGHICDLLDEIGIPGTLAEIGVPEDCTSRIAAKALQDSAAGTNPRSLTQGEVDAVITEAITFGR